MKNGMLKLAGLDLELFEDGGGAPLLFLHSARGLQQDQAFVDRLAKTRRVIVPSHPGFGHSGLPDWLDTPDDIAHIYLELMDRLGLAKADLAGITIGGWIAAEMATKAPERFRKIALVAPVGVKTGPVDKLDIPDVFAVPQERIDRWLYLDPAKHVTDTSRLSDDELTVMVRNRETFAMLVWEPWMHNPKLKHRLQRIAAPTLFVRGESDEIVSADYTERYARLVPNARVETIANAAHAVQAEQPDALAAKVLGFLDA